MDLERLVVQALRLVAATEAVVTGVDRDPVQPRGELGFTTKPVEVAEAREEGLLGGVAGVLGVAEHPVGEVVDAPLVPLHQVGKRLLVTTPGPPNQLRVRRVRTLWGAHAGPWTATSATSAANRPPSG